MELGIEFEILEFNEFIVPGTPDYQEPNSEIRTWEWPKDGHMWPGYKGEFGS